jgi:hypothetical protein
MQCGVRGMNLRAQAMPGFQFDERWNQGWNSVKEGCTGSGDAPSSTQTGTRLWKPQLQRNRLQPWVLTVIWPLVWVLVIVTESGPALLVMTDPERGHGRYGKCCSVEWQPAGGLPCGQLCRAARQWFERDRGKMFCAEQSFVQQEMFHGSSFITSVY